MLRELCAQWGLAIVTTMAPLGHTYTPYRGATSVIDHFLVRQQDLGRVRDTHRSVRTEAQAQLDPGYDHSPIACVFPLLRRWVTGGTARTWDRAALRFLGSQEGGPLRESLLQEVAALKDGAAQDWDTAETALTRAAQAFVRTRASPKREWMDKTAWEAVQLK